MNVRGLKRKVVFNKLRELLKEKFDKVQLRYSLIKIENTIKSKAIKILNKKDLLPNEDLLLDLLLKVMPSFQKFKIVWNHIDITHRQEMVKEKPLLRAQYDSRWPVSQIWELKKPLPLSSYHSRVRALRADPLESRFQSPKKFENIVNTSLDCYPEQEKRAVKSNRGQIYPTPIKK